MWTWADWKAQAETAEIDGRAVALYDLGPRGAPALTYLHGYPSSSLDIAPVLDLLGDSVRTLTLDFPGFGASAKPTGHRYSIHAAADAVEALWRASAAERTLLVAHDYGVSVAQELVARHLDGSLDVALDGVVWINGGVYPDLHRPTLGQQVLLDAELSAQVLPTVTEDSFREGIGHTWGERRELDAAEIHEMWRSMDEGGGILLMHDLLHYVDDRREHEQRWRDALESRAVDASFVWGDLDPVSGAHMIERVEQRRPDATVRRLADVGHWPPLEAPDEVAAVITAALPG